MAAGFPTEFDEYLEVFKKHSPDTEQNYWADVIYLMQSHPTPLVEQRFRAGMTGWWFWIAREILRPSALPLKSPISRHPSGFSAGFRLLPTPAHAEALSPLIDAAPPSDTILYGNPDDKDIDPDCVPLGLPRSSCALSISEKFQALRRAFGRSRAILKTLRASERLAVFPRNGFSARVTEFFYTHEVELARHRKSGIQLRSLFVSYELSVETKALVDWARECDARVIHVMHGQRFPTYQVTRATDLVLFSKIDKPWFSARVSPEVKLWTCGHPRLEKIRREVIPHLESSGLPRITFFSQPAELHYSRDERLEDWKILAGLKDKAVVRFRPHPRENQQDALRDMKAAGLDFVECSENSLIDDLIWCDAVASSWSTASMEAAVSGRGIFWTCSAPERYQASQELRDNGVGVLLTSAADWSAYLQRRHPGRWEAPVIVPEARLIELGMIGEMEKNWMERLDLPYATSEDSNRRD